MDRKMAYKKGGLSLTRCGVWHTLGVCMEDTAIKSLLLVVGILVITFSLSVLQNYKHSGALRQQDGVCVSLLPTRWRE
jgi:hypothetical protein